MFSQTNPPCGESLLANGGTVGVPTDIEQPGGPEPAAERKGNSAARAPGSGETGQPLMEQSHDDAKMSQPLVAAIRFTVSKCRQAQRDAERADAHPWWLRFAVAITAGLAIANLSFLQSADITALRALSLVFSAFGDTLMMLPVFSLSRICTTLSASQAAISAEESTRLRRWRMLVFVSSALAALGYWGMFNVVHVGILGNEDPFYEDFQIKSGETALTSQQRLHAVMLGLYAVVVAPLLGLSWFLSLKKACVLVRAEVTDCRALIDNTSARSHDWDKKVVPDLLNLVQQTVPVLSKGWSDGLLALWAGLWVVALGNFAKYLDGGNPVDLAQTVASVCLPLLLAMDVASVSTAIDKLGETLNTKRADDMSYENHIKLEVTESLLRNLNKGQGLGFVVGGMVLNTATLQNIFVVTMGFLSTAVTLCSHISAQSVTDALLDSNGTRIWI